MLDLFNSNKQIKEIKNSNDYITFLDDTLETIEEISIFDMSKVLGDSFLFPNISQHSFFKSTSDYKELENYLINTYINNENKPTGFSETKESILDHFEDYFVRNHDNLNEYVEVTAHTNEYNLISYNVYKGLVNIYPQFKTNKDTFKVNSLVSSELLYKLSVQLPEYISEQELIKKEKIFEDLFKSRIGKKDLEVRVVIEKINTNMVFTISRFKNKDTVALGDILNFGIGYSYSDIRSNVYNQPLILGLLDNESPKILDYSENKNIAIIGVKKECPIAYSFVTNLVLMNHYEDLNFIICTQRENTFWKMFSRNPHVLGYHTDYENFKDVVNDVYDLVEKRVKLAKKKKCKNYNDLKKHIKGSNGQLMLIMDGLSKILTSYRTILSNASEQNYSNLLSMLNYIAEHSQLTGVTIMGISERGDKSAFPKEIMNNTLVKIALSESSENDINTLFGTDSTELSKPIGLDYSIVEYIDNFPKYCKTCSVGGLTDKQMLAIIRVVAFDWVRKSMFNDISVVEQPKNYKMLFAYNRNLIIKDSISKIVDGKVIPSW